MSGPRYLLQTAHLESQSWGHFVRTGEAMRPSKDHDPTPFKLTRSWCRLYASISTALHVVWFGEIES